ncbi:MAG TPA: hypothetical protein VGJ86_23115 [Acidimicrobiales bacterium]|jgi:hypothetical protein
MVAAALVLALLVAPLLAFVHFAPTWAPAGDPGVMALRALDVGTSRNPLVGQVSTARAFTPGHFEVYHPGPIHYYMLAPAIRLLGAAYGMLVMSLLINGSALLVAAWAMFRQLGRRAGVLTVVGLSAITFTTGAASLIHPVNAAIAAYPLLCAMVLVWCLLCGDLRLLPLTVAFVSFTAQQNLSVLPTMVLSLGVGLGAVVWGFVRQRGWRIRSARRQLLGWGGAATVIGALLWAPPLIDQFTNEPGNLGMAWRFAREGDRESLGFSSSLRQMAHVLGWPPVLYRQDLTGPVFLSKVGAFTWVAAVAVVIAIAVLGVRWRRSHPRRAAAAMMVVTLIVAGLINGASEPTGFGSGRLDFYHWIWPLLLFVMLLPALALTDWLDRFGDRLRDPRRQRLRVGGVVVALAVVLVPALVNPSLERWSNNTAEAGPLVDRQTFEDLVGQVLDDPGRRSRLEAPTVVLGRGEDLFDGFELALGVELEQRGYPVLQGQVLAPNLHEDRIARQATVQNGLVLVVDPLGERTSTPGELVAEVRLVHGFDREAYDALAADLTSVDRLELAPVGEAAMTDEDAGTRMILTALLDRPRDERGAMLLDPSMLRMLLRYPLARPTLDPSLLRRVRDSLPDDSGLTRVASLRIYLQDRDELLQFAGDGDLGA